MQPRSRSPEVQLSNQPPVPAETDSILDLEVDSLDVQSVLDAFPFYVMLIDEDHRVLMTNKAVVGALGRDPRRIVGGYCPTVVHGLAGPFPGCPLERAVTGDGDVECDLHDPDAGTTVLSGVYPTGRRTRDGRRVYLHTTRDVTEERAAGQRLERAHAIQHAVGELLRVALEPIPLRQVFQRFLELVAGVPWLDLQSAGALLLADEPEGELVVRARIGDVQGACGDGDEAHHWRVPIVRGEEVLGMMRLHTRSGAEIRPEQREFISAVASVMAGIIQRHRTEAQRMRHERVALSRERMARVGEITAGVAHTIRNPLHGALNCIEILGKRVAGDEDATEVLEMMREGLTRIEKVTRRVLLLTRDLELRPRLTEVDALLNDAVRLLTPLSEARGVAMQVVQGVGTPAQLVLDPDRVSEALGNVLGNAMDACRRGGRVSVEAQDVLEPTQALMVRIRDTGVGIPAEHLARVQDAFFTTKPVGEGSGLGLAITRRVMEEHDGQIEIDSELGAGTEVRLFFPR